MTPAPLPKKKTLTFSPATKKEWKEVAQREWEGTPPVSLTPPEANEITIDPYYDRSDLPSHSNSQLFSSADEYLGARAWLNMPMISCKNDGKANQSASHWLASGADGIIFELSDESDPETLLQGVELPYCNISFLADQGQEKFFQKFLLYVRTKKYSPESISGTIFWKRAPARLTEVVRLFVHWPRFHACGILEENDNKTPADDLAVLLAKAVKQIDILTSPLPTLQKAGPGRLPESEVGVEIKYALQSIAFSLPTGPDFFLEIAKLKVLRMLWHQVVKSYPSSNHSSVFIHANSRTWIRPEYEPHSNLLKSTTSALSAILGGCDSLTVHAEDASTEWMARIARNVSSLLREESHLSTVADPVAGSYFLENFIDRLAQHTWKKFQELV